METGLSPILFVLVVSATGVPSQIIKGPANALKKVGDSVTLDCLTRSKNCDQVEWSKMEGAQSPLTVYRDGMMLNPSLFPPGRYSVNSTSGCNLTITQLKINDSGRFSCSQLIGDKQETRGSVLVVIDVREACLSNVTSNALNQNHSYSFWTTINVPAKSVEPSNVILSFQNKAVGETETTDESQPQTTVKKTLIGIARKANITQHMCRASFPPTTGAGFDSSTASLDVCTTQQLIVSYPVENVAVSPGPYYKEATVICTAEGHPYPSFNWTHVKSGHVVNGDTLKISGEVGDEYRCIATNRLTVIAQPKTIVVVAASESSHVGAIIACLILVPVVAIIVSLVVCWFLAWCPLYKQLHSITDKKDKNPNGGTASMPLNAPEKPPRASDTPVPLLGLLIKERFIKGLLIKGLLINGLFIKGYSSKANHQSIYLGTFCRGTNIKNGWTNESNC